MPTPTRVTSQAPLPERVQIGPTTYQVAVVEELADGSAELYGDIDYGKCRIRITAESDAQKQRVTLWHEVLHAILYQAGMTDHDEQVIDALAYGITQALRENEALHHA